MDNHTLENGCTFLAVTGGSYGGWAKALDPVTAIKDAVRNGGSQDAQNGVAVMVLYGPSDTLNCGAMGGFNYETTPEGKPTPIGLFFCKGRSIQPMKKGDLGPDHPDHEKWMKDTSSDIEEDVAWWVKNNENEANQ